MRSVNAVMLALSVVGFALAAKADTISTYTFSSVTLTENKGGTKIYGTVTGYVSIDATTGVVQSTGNDFTATYGATNSDGSNPTASYTFTDLVKANDSTSSDNFIDAVFLDTTGTTNFYLEYTDPGGVITLCVTGGGCTGRGGAAEQTHLDTTPNEDLIVGTLAASSTPEPSSLLLLGTGLLGFAGRIVRKR